MTLGNCNKMKRPDYTFRPPRSSSADVIISIKTSTNYFSIIRTILCLTPSEAEKGGWG